MLFVHISFECHCCSETKLTNACTYSLYKYIYILYLILLLRFEGLPSEVDDDLMGLPPEVDDDLLRVMSRDFKTKGLQLEVDDDLLRVVRRDFLAPPSTLPYRFRFESLVTTSYREMFPSWILINSILQDLYSGNQIHVR